MVIYRFQILFIIEANISYQDILQIIPAPSFGNIYVLFVGSTFDQFLLDVLKNSSQNRQAIPQVQVTIALLCASFATVSLS